MRYSLYERYTHRTYVTSKGRYAVIYDKFTQKEFEISNEHLVRGNPHLFKNMVGVVNRVVDEYNKEDQQYLADINEYCG